MEDQDFLRIQKILRLSDEEVGPACSRIEVPPTVVMDDDFREVYAQGYRHAFADIRAYLARMSG